jgi:hypothetical protein
MDNKKNNNNHKHDIATFDACMKYLNVSGYKTEFKATAEGLFSKVTNKIFQPKDVTIAHYYRFEGEKNSAHIAIVYALETNDGEKGTLVGKYESANDENIANFIAKVKNNKK